MVEAVHMSYIYLCITTEDYKYSKLFGCLNVYNLQLLHQKFSIICNVVLDFFFFFYSERPAKGLCLLVSKG